LGNGLFFLADGAGGTDDAAASAYTTATVGSAHSVTAKATAATQQIDAIPTTFTPSGTGLVYMKLTSDSLTCTANNTSQTASASYSGSVSYFGLLSRNSYGYTTVTFSYSNGVMTYSNGTGLPSLASVQVANNVYLSNYFSDWGLAAAPQVSANPITKTVTATLSSVFHLTTQPTNTSDATSQWTLTVGSLSCIAQDAR
jgi:hypothetical protein